MVRLMVQVERLRFAIGEKLILRGIDARFEPCRIHGIIGPNGSGKSTFLKNLCRIWQPQQGTVLIDGVNALSVPRKELSKMVTLVPQNTQINFPISVHDIVAMGRHPHLGRFQPFTKHDREIIAQALAATQIEDLKDRKINELSGGEGQLAIIARALATEAALILLDEPTSELDIKHKLTIMELLLALKAQGKTILITIHDLNAARRYCDTISIFQQGALFYRGSPAEAFSPANMRTVFAVNVTEITQDRMHFLHFY